MTARRNISELRESIPKDQKVSRFVLQERAFPGASADFPVSHVSKPCAIPAGPRFPMFVAVLDQETIKNIKNKQNIKKHIKNH